MVKKLAILFLLAFSFFMFSSCGVSPENVDNSNNETYTVYLDKVKSEATCPDTIVIKKDQL